MVLLLCFLYVSLKHNFDDYYSFGVVVLEKLKKEMEFPPPADIYVFTTTTRINYHSRTAVINISVFDYSRTTVINISVFVLFFCFFLKMFPYMCYSCTVFLFIRFCLIVVCMYPSEVVNSIPKKSLDYMPCLLPYISIR